MIWHSVHPGEHGAWVIPHQPRMPVHHGTGDNPAGAWENECSEELPAFEHNSHAVSSAVQV